MKKVLVLLVVLGLASYASAALVVEYDAAAASVNVTAPAEEPQQAIFLAAEAGLELGAGEMLYTGTLSAITEFLGVDPDMDAMVAEAISAVPVRFDFIELYDGTAEPPPVTGRLVSYPYLGGQGMAYLLDAESLAVVDSALVPEPITIALLGLGGLFLRRRR